MALTTVEYSSYFHYDESTKQIKFTDSTDYASQGTTDANVTIVAKVEGPSGVFYNNTNHGAPDIDPDVSLDSVNLIALPLGGDGLPEQGLYTITLEYEDLVVGPTTVVDVKTFTLDYSSPTIDISMEADCVTPLLSATDDTAYTVNSVAPTVVRDFKIHYPPSTPTADVTGTAASINTRIFYTVADSTIEHSSSLTSTLTYLFDSPELIYVVDEVTGSKVIQVACDGDICDIYCCIRSQWNRYKAAKNDNSVLAAKELEKYMKIIALSSMVGNAVKCGKNSHIAEYVAEILLIADCDAGCSCEDGTPQLVTGLAINGNDVVVDAGTGVSVSSVTGGGTTTYTVSLTTANINKLAATYNSVVAAGTNISSVASVSSTVADVTTTTYTVHARDTVVDSLFVRAKLTMNPALVPVITITDQALYGSVFAAVNQTGGTEFIVNENDATFNDWDSKYTEFTIGNFGSPGTAFYPEVKIVNVDAAAKGFPTTWQNNLTVDIIAMGTNEFTIRFSDENGNAVNGSEVQDFNSMELIFKIQA